MIVITTPTGAIGSQVLDLLLGPVGENSASSCATPPSSLAAVRDRVTS